MEFGKSIVVALLGLSWILSVLLIVCSIVVYFNILGSGILPEILSGIIVLITMWLNYKLFDELTDAQRDESKAITFRLLYGGIDKEFLSIPFFQQVNDFVFKLWNTWKRNGCIKTPIIARSICKDQINNMTSFKLFNYYLQATETEVSVNKLSQLQDYLQDYTTCIILYTYDSVMLDVPLSEAKTILPEIKNLLEQGKFPVKCKVGDIYDKMRTITL